MGNPFADCICRRFLPILYSKKALLGRREDLGDFSKVSLHRKQGMAHRRALREEKKLLVMMGLQELSGRTYIAHLENCRLFFGRGRRGLGSWDLDAEEDGVAKHDHCKVYLLAAPSLSALACLQAPVMLSSHVLHLPPPSGSYLRLMVWMMIFYCSSKVMQLLW